MAGAGGRSRSGRPRTAARRPAGLLRRPGRPGGQRRHPQPRPCPGRGRRGRRGRPRRLPPAGRVVGPARPVDRPRRHRVVVRPLSAGDGRRRHVDQTLRVRRRSGARPGRHRSLPGPRRLSLPGGLHRVPSGPARRPRRLAGRRPLHRRGAAGRLRRPVRRMVGRRRRGRLPALGRPEDRATRRHRDPRPAARARHHPPAASSAGRALRPERVPVRGWSARGGRPAGRRRGGGAASARLPPRCRWSRPR